MNTRPDQIEEDDAAGLPDDEDDLTAALRANLSKMDDDDAEEDNGGFDAPLDESKIESRDTVSEEDGVKRVQEARDKATSAAGKKAKDEEDEDDPLKQDGEKPKAKAPAAAAEPKADDKGAETPDPNQTPEVREKQLADDAAYEAAIGGLSEDVRNRIQAEREEYQGVMAPFKGREDQLKALGVDKKDAVAWFVNVNDYAQRDPAGYAAWAISQTSNGDAQKVEEVLKNAAEKLGYSIQKSSGPDDDDDDPFMSDRERELLEENRRLKGAQAPVQDYGPDSQQEVGRRAVMEVITEADESGQPVRPHFDKLQPMILNIVKQEVAATGRPMTADSLRKAYEQAELAHPETRDAATERLLEARKFAAQGNPDVAKRNNKDAAATARAKAASSKIIDGPGQGASRQTATEDADMGLEAFLRKQMSGGS